MNTFSITILSLVAASSLALAQDPPSSPQSPAPNGGWRRLGNGTPSATGDPAPSPAPEQQSYNIPPQLTIKPGTYVTVRVNQPLSSDRNQVGDAFSATLVRPIVVDGIVVAQRGETVGGRVAEVQKAGRVSGVSKLGIQMTDLTLVDGQVMPMQSQLVSRNGPTSYGRDATGIAATTLGGAAIGAGVNGGVGAGVGAAAGLVVGVVGVMFTRGHPTVIYPETVLTFRVEAPITVSTERSQQAFRYVDPREYDRPEPRLQARAPGYGAPPPPYYAPYYGYPYYGPGFGYYGPSFYYGFGPRFYFRGRFR
jgi:hypothetical protein